jgi:cytochrome c556
MQLVSANPRREYLMMTLARTLAAGLAVLGLILGFLAGNRSSADETAEVREAILKAANAIAKGDADSAKKVAENLAKSLESVEAAMNLMAKRNPTNPKKGGFGVGDKPGAISPDGIEAKVMALAKKPLTDSQLNNESAALEEMTTRIAAIAEVAKAKVPEKDQGSKKKADWIKWSDEMRKGADELGQAAKSKKPAAVRTAAKALNDTCSNCHGTFRE